MGEAVATKKQSRLTRRQFLILGVIVVLCAVSAFAYWLVQFQKKPAIDIGKGSEIAGTVQTLTPQQQQEVADVHVLIPGRDVDWLYAKAVALSALDKQQEALKTYETLDKTDKAPYYIYVEYALTASRAGDADLASRLLSKALEKLESDPSVSDADKAVLKRRLPGTLEAFKEGA